MERPPVAEPDDLLHPQRRAQVALDLVGVELRIAVRVQQALARRQQPALAVHIDAAAFQHEIMHMRAEALVQRQRGRRVGVAVHQVLAAPAIEPEHLRLPVCPCPRDDRAGIAQPDVAGRQAYPLRRRAGRRQRRGHRLVRADGQLHLHMRRRRVNESRNVGARRREVAAPLFGKARPARPEGGLRRPFGREEGIWSGHVALRLAIASPKGKGRPRKAALHMVCPSGIAA
jgi:hypothetical protein